MLAATHDSVNCEFANPRTCQPENMSTLQTREPVNL
jgi:hypothetical protein